MNYYLGYYIGDKKSYYSSGKIKKVEIFDNIGRLENIKEYNEDGELMKTEIAKLLK